MLLTHMYDRNFLKKVSRFVLNPQHPEVTFVSRILWKNILFLEQFCCNICKNNKNIDGNCKPDAHHKVRNMQA